VAKLQRELEAARSAGAKGEIELVKDLEEARSKVNVCCKQKMRYYCAKCCSWDKLLSKNLTGKS